MLIDSNSYNLKKIINRIGFIRSYMGKLTDIKAKPKELILEITNNCNLACIMCPRINMKRPLGFMDFKLFQNIIDQVKDYIELVYISGGLGEPLLHPRLSDMINYCRKLKVRVGLSTNATLLTTTITSKLLKYSPDIMLFSLDGATKITHEKIRVGSKFEKTMNNVINFLKMKEKRKLNLPYTIIQMIYMPENQHEADYFKKKWQKFQSVNDIRMKKFLHLQGSDYFPAINLTKKNNLPCILPWKQFSISWDGKVALCCRDYYFNEIIGDVKKKSILNIWNSANMKEYRKLLTTGQKKKIPLCRNCKGIQTNLLTNFASILFDDLSIRKLLPLAEKLVLKTGIKLIDYE